jgi:hypothetical protein
MFPRCSVLFGVAATVVFTAGFSAAASAQTASPKIVITNLNPVVEIPLGTASTVDFDAAGDLRVQCRVDGAGGCPGLGSGGSGGSNPPALVTLGVSAASILTGQSVTLNWTSSSGTEACYGAGPSGISNWTGQVLPANGNRAVTLSTEGNYTFQLRCYNATGSRTADSPPLAVEAGTTPPPGDNYCAEVYGSNPPTSPNFTAFGFEKVEVPYGQVWGVPGAPAPKRGVPGIYVSPSANRYIAIPFVMTSDAGDSLSQMRISWVEAQPVWGESPPTNNIKTGAISLTVSPCPGDFRPRANLSNPDRYLHGACRILSPDISGNIEVTAATGLAGCLAPKGKTMYLNIATYNMFGTSAPTTTTCPPNESTCGVSMLMQ